MAGAVPEPKSRFTVLCALIVVVLGIGPRTVPAAEAATQSETGCTCAFASLADPRYRQAAWPMLLALK